MAHVLLYEPNAALRSLLANFFADEGLDVTTYPSVAHLQAAAAEFPAAIVVIDSAWTDYGYAELGDAERDLLNALGQRTTVIVTTARSWANQRSPLNLAPTVTVVAKPYDVEELLTIVRERVRQSAALPGAGTSVPGAGA